MVNEMTFEAFAAEYKKTFALMMSYELNQIGSKVYCEKLADLADAYPEFLEALEAEVA